MRGTRIWPGSSTRKQMLMLAGQVCLLVLISFGRAVAADPAQQEGLQGYALGWKLGQIVKKQHPAINFDKVVKGMEDALTGATPMISEEQINQLSRQLAEQKPAASEESRAKEAAERARQVEANKKEGAEFLAKNKSAKGVVTTASGLQYTVLAKGSGPSPRKGDLVGIHYRGSFVDGTEFDNTYRRGRPYDAVVEKSIPGWAEILPQMAVGSKYRLFLKPELAYGDKGYGPVVPPQTTVIYELELMSIGGPGQSADPALNTAFSQVDLTSMERAAGSFMRLYTGISPEYSDKSLTEICRTVATESFFEPCSTLLSKRLATIRGIKGVKKATFTDKQIIPPNAGQKTVLISWQEQLTLEEDKTITNRESMLLLLTEKDSLWRIENISMKPAAATPAPAAK